MNWILRMFSKSMPKPGEIYYLQPGDDPFPKSRITVEVLETKKGWVRYRFTSGSDHESNDYRLPRVSFYDCYSKEPQP